MAKRTKSRVRKAKKQDGRQAYNAPLTKPHKARLEVEKLAKIPCKVCGRPSVSQKHLCKKCYDEWQHENYK